MALSVVGLVAVSSIAAETEETVWGEHVRERKRE